MVIAWVLGGLALLALSRPRAMVSNAALASLGVVTDVRYWAVEPASLLPAVEITDVQILEDPVVVGTYPKIWVSIISNASSPLLGNFVRIYDDDTGVLVGVKKDAYLVPEGATYTAQYDGFDDWNMTMPNRTWNLRIEVGTN